MHAPSKICDAAWWRDVLLPLLVVAFGASPIGAAEPMDQSSEPFRLRVEWGGGQARQWNGVVEVSEGRISRPTSLGVEADEPGTLWISNNALWIERRSPRVYDGFDATITAVPEAMLNITLQSIGENPIHEQVQFRLREVDSNLRVAEIDDEGTRLVVRRTPGDEIRLQIDRPHLVFAPGENFVASALLSDFPAETDTPAAVLSWRVTAARTAQEITQGDQSAYRDSTTQAASEIPMAIKLPMKEGVYDLHLALRQDGSPARKRMVQVVVVADDPSREPADGEASLTGETLIDSFQPANAGFLRRVGRRRDFRFLNDSWNRLLAMFPQSREKPNPSTPTSKVDWSAFRLRIRNPGRPHRLVVTASSSATGTLGISLLEPNAAGQLMPVGLDTGVSVVGNTAQADGDADASGSDHPIRHEVLFWPKIDDPVLLVSDLGTGRRVAVRDVEVFELSSLGSRSESAELPGALKRRLIGPYMHKPMLPDNFGSTETYDPASRRSLDDWATFHSAAIRLVRYLHHGGYNSLMLGAFADGSTIFPSRLLQPTPRYDTGIYFSSGQDPVRKDVLELLYRVFDREDLALIPELQFSTPLPVLEKMLADAPGRARGIELIGRDGRSWRESRGSSRGLAPYYNPLDPRVQEAILQVVEELVSRYHSHHAFRGVAVELSSVGYLQFPGLEWGYDDATVARFERATGVRVPIADGPEKYQRRYEFLTKNVLSHWVGWRCEELARFHIQLAHVVTEKKATSRLYLSGNRTLRGSNPDDDLVATLKSGGKLVALLAPKGLDFKLYSGVDNLTVLRSSSWGLPRHSLDAAMDDTVNYNPNLEAVVSDCSVGSLFYHLPYECRIPEFDSLSPWQPAYTWLAAHVSSTGQRNRERYAHALASYDAPAIFDGGWMIPLGQERHTRQMRDVFQELPAIRFHRFEPHRQPVVVRTARDADSTWLYVVNEFSSEVNVELSLSCGTGATGRLLGKRSLLRLEPSSRAGSRVIFSIDPAGVWACQLHDPNVKVESVEFVPARKALAAIEGKIRRLGREISRVQQPPKLSKIFLTNPGFEQSAENQSVLPGWELSERPALSWALDESNPRSGKSALMLAAGQEDVASLSSDLPLDDNRELSMSIWLRSDRADADVRLVFEASVREEKQLQYAKVRVDKQWRRYLFRVKDIPTDRLEDARVRVEVRGAGKVWIDDVEIHMHRLTPADLRQLTKVFSAISIAWEEERYTDCQRLLSGYWGQLLIDEPPPQREPPRQTTNRLLRFFKR
jgi:hypothetical protein